ncbi:MAG TPA: amidohydrolase family protein [Caulobacteraceae bacterium]|jgi:predicted TIM-barrel fold metal-dependent hydrolase
MIEAAAPREPILDPGLPIIDPHHHLWDRTAAQIAALPAPQHPFEHVAKLRPRYLLDELLGDLNSGHNIRATVYLQCGVMYRADGPEHLRCVGETEFVNGVAAMTASGLYGEVRACAGIVGHADLTLGDRVVEVLERHIAAGGGRFRGIRNSASHDADPAVLGPLARTPAGLYAEPGFRQGFARLAPLGLSFDAWLLEPQLPDLIDLARAFPDTPIVLDHVGTPLGIASYAERREERFPIWRENIRALAACPQVSVKLGGLAMAFPGFASFMAKPPATSSQLAAEWRPYVEACIEAFGPDRCMFESNFPVDICSCSYDVLWNAFKLIAAGYSADEKTALFSATANRVYRLGL